MNKERDPLRDKPPQGAGWDAYEVWTDMVEERGFPEWAWYFRRQDAIGALNNRGMWLEARRRLQDMAEGPVHPSWYPALTGIVFLEGDGMGEVVGAWLWPRIRNTPVIARLAT